MKTLLTLATLVLTLTATASEVPNTPPSACYGGCTRNQEKLLYDFEVKGVLPQSEPAVYSGVCNHTGLYRPEDDHYTVVLLDQVEGKWNFSAIYGYYLPENEWAGWTLEDARREMSPYWKEYGNITTGDNTARVRVNYEDGSPAYIYWMRQNIRTKELLLISYAGTVTRSFCRLKKH